MNDCDVAENDDWDAGAGAGADDGSECSAEEGLMFLLGGLSTEAMASTQWAEEASAEGATQGGTCGTEMSSHGMVMVQLHRNSNSNSNSASSDSARTTVRTYDKPDTSRNSDGDLHSPDAWTYRRAFSTGTSPSTGGRINILKPAVEILDLSSEGRGNILIATQSIPKGQVIFTERAVLAAQVPLGHCHIATREPANHKHVGIYTVRACQHCFRSLEPASSLSKQIKESYSESNNESENDSAVLRGEHRIPMPEMWPVPEYHYPNQHESQRNQTGAAAKSVPMGTGSHHDLDLTSGRITCSSCRALFCSTSCANSYKDTLGSCCVCVRAIEALVHLSCRSSADGHASGPLVRTDSSNTHEHDESETAKNVQQNDISCGGEKIKIDIDPVIILAARMFIAQVQSYRSAAVGRDLFHGLCGEAMDIPILQLGSFDAALGTYTLEKEYEAIANAIQLSEAERQSPFSLHDFHRMVAKAQRNAISLTTGSPFRTYYQAVLRNTGGRGSTKQQRIVSELAKVLGSENGTLTRDMDQVVESKVC